MVGQLSSAIRKAQGAAARSVTLAARGAGMSRKSAYGLKSPDPAFAHAWEAALNARPKSRKGGQVKDVQAAPHSRREGDGADRAAPSTSSTGRVTRDRRREEAARDLFFARRAATNRFPLSPAAADLLPSPETLSLRSGGER